MFNGRQWNPPNRFNPVSVDWDEEAPRARLQITEDHSQSILARNHSSDLRYRWSLNPYRGCTHACAYCYARHFHEFLDLGAGSDFERRISIKPHAAELLQQVFDRRSWAGDPILFSGATDCYQPLESRYRLTRACLTVAARYRNPVAIVTRSPRIVDDLGLLVELAQVGAVGVSISLPILDPKICRALEPGTASPAARLRAIRALAEAGIPVGVSLAPVIPGLTDAMLPDAICAAAEAGAGWAWMSLLRLPGNVAEVFESRLRQRLPEHADKVLAKLRRHRGGQLDEAQFGARMRGVDAAWDVTERLFKLWCKRTGLRTEPIPLEHAFRRPGHGQQMALFGA